jgi:hypothetical protein
MVKEIKLRMHKIISKQALQCSSVAGPLTEEDNMRKESSETRFLLPLLGISLQDKIICGPSDIKKPNTIRTNGRRGARKSKEMA